MRVVRTAPFLQRSNFTQLPLPGLFCRRSHISTKADFDTIEEQTTPRYNQRHYYPVNIGDILKDQYRVIAKLGYGAYSTVYGIHRPQDLHTRRYRDFAYLE
ncbi:hypothetical protein BU16DRAFT_556190 [Lophium mytilinum]|uniref:Protein kinase domain-containing protein n=1 Tax=Lophium mytilinum TaxID=390894 RepID=A0A6A6RBI1_9PEZI|nr:hypothetical protein BU16DRAFT_556190 [Lophium mytilinum]